MFRWATKTKPEIKPKDQIWEILEEGRIRLVGTKLEIVHVGGDFPFHVHRNRSCYACLERLGQAKLACIQVVNELNQMGMEP